MQVLIVGATGPTGQELVKQALDAGHTVKVLARNPDKLSLPQPNHAKLQVIHGDVCKLEDVRSALDGCDALISGLGGKPGVFTSCDIYSKSLGVFLKALKDAGVKRFITVTSWGTKDDPELPYILRWVIKPSMLRNVLADMEVMEDQLVKEEEINWTVVKPPRLVNEPLTGLAPLTQEGQLVRGLASRAHLCRADLAKFMLDCLTTSKWDRKQVAVTSGACGTASSEGNSVDGESKGDN